MKRGMSWALLVAGTALTISAAPVMPAAAATGSFTGTVSGRALLVRNPDGSCSLAQVPRHEVDKFTESGTLSF